MELFGVKKKIYISLGIEDDAHLLQENMNDVKGLKLFYRGN
jgi:hypothetical protein